MSTEQTWIVSRVTDGQDLARELGYSGAGFVSANTPIGTVRASRKGEAILKARNTYPSVPVAELDVYLAAAEG